MQSIRMRDITSDTLDILVGHHACLTTFKQPAMQPFSNFCWNSLQTDSRSMLDNSHITG